MFSLVFFLPLISSLEMETTTFQSFIDATLVPLDSQTDGNGTLHCPNYANSISNCKQDSTAYYNECCGVELMYCCVKFKTWFIITFSISLLIGIFLAILACYKYFKEDKDDV